MQTELFIDGQFVPAVDGLTAPTLNPHDNSKIADVARRARRTSTRRWPLRVLHSRRGARWRRWIAAVCCSSSPMRSSSMPMSWRSSSRSTPVIRCAIRRASMCRAPRSRSAISAAWPTRSKARVVPVEQGFLNYTLRQPVGVVGQIVPWNFPLMFTSWKMAPALAAGNCVVMKPAELTPLSSLRIAELMARGRLSEGRREHPAGLRQQRRPVHRRASGHRQDRPSPVRPRRGARSCRRQPEI